MQRLRDQYFQLNWVKRAKQRRKKTCRVLLHPELLHDEKIELLKQHKEELLRWLRFQPLRFFFRSDALQEGLYVREEIRRINAGIEKIKKSKARLAKWQNDNPAHPYNRHAS